MRAIPSLTLNNGVTIPQLGYGVFQVPPGDAQRMTRLAFESGYRHVDTAAGYRNEEGVGRAVRESSIPRADLFVTSKLWNADQGYEKALAGFERSRKLLGLDYVDLYLIHFPAPTRLAYRETWRAFEKLYNDGVVKAIGVSNFKFPYLDRLLATADIGAGRASDRGSSDVSAGRTGCTQQVARNRGRGIQSARPRCGSQCAADRRDR
jgi:2,5-diketo-D-gluconate reductase A